MEFFEIRKLKNIQKVLETNNSIHKVLKNEKNFGLFEFYTALKNEKQPDVDNFNFDLNTVFNFLKKYREQFDSEDLNEMDINLFKKEMIEIQNTLQNMGFNCQTNLTKLQQEEQNLSEELESYDAKLNEWTKPIDYSLIQAPRIDTGLPKSNFTKEVKAFLDFIDSSNGHENGWSIEDHQFYLKMRNKFKNVDTLAEKVHDTLPDISVEEIKKHEAWYKKYTELNTKKKESLKKWKDSKIKNHQPSQTIKPKVNYNLSPMESKQKLAVWKAEKELKILKDKEFEEMKKQKQKELEQKQKEYNKKIKSSVEQWKSAKTINKQLDIVDKKLKEISLKKEKATIANEMIKMFQSQDDYFIKKKKQQIENKTKNSIIFRSKSSQMVGRNPERLHQPTMQWIRRNLKQESTDSTFNRLDLSQIQKLKVPDWRKNLK